MLKGDVWKQPESTQSCGIRDFLYFYNFFKAEVLNVGSPDVSEKAGGFMSKSAL